MDTAQLNLIVIRSTDGERAVRFYSALGLTFTRHRHGNGPEHYACESGPVIFEIYPARDDGEVTAGIRLGFRVASVADTVAALVESGGTVVSSPKLSPWGLRAVVADPDGHRVELTEPLPATS